MQDFIQKNKELINPLLQVLQSYDNHKRSFAINALEVLCESDEDWRLLVNYIKKAWEDEKFTMKKDVHDWLIKIQLGF